MFPHRHLPAYDVYYLYICRIEFEERYSKTMFAIQEAAEFGKSGVECAGAYKW